MNREFLEFYERELNLLYEQSRDYGTEFPGIADRLGGLNREAMDPGIVRLLEGTAFLAARVQLKLKSEFSEFTSALLEQLLPDYLAPVPSSLIIQAEPPFKDPALAAGLTYAAGSTLDAIYVEAQHRVSCRYELGSELKLWPLWLEAAEYFPGPAPLQAGGLEVLPGTAAGLQLSLLYRTGDEIPPKTSGGKPTDSPVSNVLIDELPVHLVGNPGDVNAVYEQIFANCLRITLKWEAASGDPQFISLTMQQLEQLGFEEDDVLGRPDERTFAGFEFLRSYFVFPQRYAGFRLKGLRNLMSRIQSNRVDIIFEFDRSVPHLAPIVDSQMFALYASPATNLFEKACARVPIDRSEYEHHVVADRSHGLDFEVHSLVDVFAHYSGRNDKVPVYPLYSLPAGGAPSRDALYYTTRKLPRRLTDRERTFGTPTSYIGTETFISLYEPGGIDDGERVKELSVRAVVSNRGLAGQLPTGRGGADFRLTVDTAIPLRCIGAPSQPRDSVVHMERKQRDSLRPGPVMWQLINFLSLSHLGLSGRDYEDRADALRDLLAIFADLSDGFTERQVRGILSVSTRPIVRRLRQPSGFNAARGLEITVTFDEKAYEGTGVMLLGVALDRFFAEYTSINSFTETVIASTQRGIIKRWPPRSGLGGLL